jgi:hypothetical protein
MVPKKRWAVKQIDPPGGRVTCEAWAFQVGVIPANSGIQSSGNAFSTACGVDSRFRGNDRRFEKDPIPNDTTTALLSRVTRHTLVWGLAIGPNAHPVMLTACNFFEFARKPKLKTKNLSASKGPKSQKSHKL